MSVLDRARDQLTAGITGSTCSQVSSVRSVYSMRRERRLKLLDLRYLGDEHCITYRGTWHLGIHGRVRQSIIYCAGR